MTNFTERQNQIIQASLDIIADSGIHGLTIKNISRRVGISEPAIYRHFESKTDILMGIIAKIKENTSVELSNFADKQQDAFNLIRTVLTAHAQRFTKNPSLAAVIFSEEIFEDNIRLSASIRTLMEESQVKFVNIIKKGQNRNEIINTIDAEQLVLMIIGAFRLLVTKWHMSKNSFDLELQTEKLLKALEKVV